MDDHVGLHASDELRQAFRDLRDAVEENSCLSSSDIS